MIGRSREAAAVEELVRGGTEGGSGALLIVGEPGIGKTALLRHARAQAAAAQVLEVTGSEGERRLAFAGLAALLDPVVGHLDELPAAQAQALRGALALGPPRPGDRFSTYAATFRLLAAAAERRPVVCLVDDAHWLDRESLEALLFSARRLGAEGLVMLLAGREGISPALDGAGIARLRLEGLGARDASRLVSGRALVEPSPPVLAALVRGAAGNPLALRELATILSADQLTGRMPLPDPLPVGAHLERALLRPLADMPEETWSALLLVAADDGSPERLGRALDAAGLGMRDLEPAERAGVVMVGPTRIAFSHPLVRAAVYQEAAPPDRRAAHRALAEAAAEEGDTAALDRRAWHLALAAVGPDEDVAGSLEAAAARATARSAHQAASEALEAAARLSRDDADRGRRLLAAGGDALAAGEFARAGRLFDEVVALGADPGQVVGGLAGRGHVETYSGSALRAIDLLTEASDRVRAVSPAGAAAMLVQATVPAVMRSDLPRAEALLARSAEILPDPPPLERAYRDTAAAVVASFSGTPTHVPPETVAIVDEGLAAGDPVAAVWTLGRLQSLMLEERFDEALVGIDILIRGGREAGSPSALILPLFTRAEILRRAGRLDEATADATQSLHLARDTGQDVNRGLARWVLAQVAAVRGERDACRAHADDMLTALGTTEATALTIYANAALALLALGEGDPEEAAAHLEAVAHARRARPPQVTPMLDMHLADQAETLVRLGRVDEARTVAGALAEYADRSGVPGARAAAWRCRGLVADDDGFEEPFAEAGTWLALTSLPFERARTDLCLGERRRRARRNREARAPLAEALATFDALGAAPWAERARRELRAAGARPPGPRTAATAALTPQELQVALAVATGSTNKEVATALVISPKTVEYHLARVYTKLGVRSRAELATRMARETS
ncbi:MAG: AAA family ATPase [Thermoleophilia bacterium]